MDVEDSVMDHLSFFGGIWKRDSLERCRFVPPGPETVKEDWGWVGKKAELFLRGAPALCRIFTWDGLAILLRGYARPRGSSGPLDLERVIEELRCHYLEHGELALEKLDGSFSVALCDSHRERVILYRNLIGSGFTYYFPQPEGLLFSGNLGELAQLAGLSPCPNEEVLPTYFLFRCVPGRETLLKGFYRLLPGEEVSWDHRGVHRRQRQTFESLRGALIREQDAVDQVEDTLRNVLLDGNSYRPGAANLLSGGVDSSYLQAIWNFAIHQEDELPLSYSISVDHPYTWQDTDYAITASQALGTRHLLVPADSAYQEYLFDAVRTTAEPINHVQSAYFGHLAREMRRDGVRAGICGEGADSLFGLGLANQVHNARVLRQLLPLRWLRALAGTCSQMIRWNRLAYTFRLADRLEDWTWLEHPVNRVATFTDWPAVEACFGREAVLQACERRRQLLDQFAIPEEPLDRMHAIGYLGEAMDSAGLWATMFHRAGADLLCPFLDSRVLRLALNLPPQVRYRFRRPKDLLKRALKRQAPSFLATRSKLGFGQPIFDWLREGGQLRSQVDQLGSYAFLDRKLLSRLRREPTWFLYSLVVYDVWHRLIVEGASVREVGIPGSCEDRVVVRGVR